MATRQEILSSIEVTNLMLNESKHAHNLNLAIFQASEVEREVLKELLLRARKNRVGEPHTITLASQVA